MKRVVCCACIVGLMFAGCSTKKEIKRTISVNDYPVTVNGVAIESKPEKVIILSDVIADIAIELGFKDQIVGKSSKCDQDEISTATDVDTDEKVDIDKIKNISPQVVIYESELSDDQIKELRASHIKLIKVERAKSRNDLEKVYSVVGSIFNGSETGSAYGKKDALNILMTLDDITRIVPKQTVLQTACYLFDESGTTIKDGTFASQVMDAAGVVNIAKDLSGDAIPMDKLIFSNPDWILCDKSLKKKIINNPSFESLTAVKENKFIEINGNEILRQGQSVIKVATAIAGAVYPELLEDSPQDVIESDVESVTKSETNSSRTNSSRTNNSETKNSSSKSESSEKAVSEEKNVSDLKIQLGDSGDKVLKVQNKLDELNYLHIAPNSSFDQTMEQAVKDFQYINGLTVTGKVDDVFLDQLFSQSAIPRSDPARQK